MLAWRTRTTRPAVDSLLPIPDLALCWLHHSFSSTIRLAELGPRWGKNAMPDQRSPATLHGILRSTLHLVEYYRDRDSEVSSTEQLMTRCAPRSANLKRPSSLNRSQSLRPSVERRIRSGSGNDVQTQGDRCPPGQRVS